MARHSINPWRTEWELRHWGVPLGTDAEKGGPIYLSPSWLHTGLHILGPPGSGKSRLLFHLFQALARIPNASVIAVNAKGEFGRQCRDAVISRGQAGRLVWFDPADEERVIGYNVLKPNGLPPAVHAKAVREALLAAWGQHDIDQTPQLARHLLMVLQAARELELTLVEACQLLRPGSSVREAVLPALQDQYLREALAYFDCLREQRQDELAASTLARLEAFVTDPTIRMILTQQQRSLDLREVLGAHKILVLNLELHRPLRPTDVRLLGRLFLNDLLCHVFERPPAQRSPVYLLIDEVQLFLSEDLVHGFELGRELGLRTIISHQFLGQLADADARGRLLAAVKNCARTRIVFGGTWAADLRELVEDLFIDQYDPRRVKDELTTLELDPIESKREVVSRGTSRGWHLDLNLMGTGGRSWSQGETEAQTVGATRTHGMAFSSGHATGAQAALGAGETILPSGEVIATSHHGSATSGMDFTGETVSHAVSDIQAQSRGVTRAQGGHAGFGLGLGGGISGGSNENRSRVPFYEYRKRRVVSSRTFVGEEEFFTVHLQKLKGQPPRHFVLKVPTKPAAFVRAPQVEPRHISPTTLEQARQRIFDTQPYYSTIEEIEGEERARSARIARGLRAATPGREARAPTAPTFNESELWTPPETGQARDEDRTKAKAPRQRSRKRVQSD